MTKLALFVLLVVLGTLVYLSQPVSLPNISQEFTINQGDSLNLIAARLETNHLLRSRYPFILFSYLYGLNRRLQAGTFKLSPSLSPKEIIFKLSSGGSHDYWLKIIAGSRLEEITPPLLGAREGYVFPDSYLVPQDYTSAQILGIIDQNFQQKFSQAKANTTPQLSDSEVVILASLLEREARLLPTKQMIAGILLNRLNLGMALQVDATVQYARDSLRHPAIYWQPLSRSDLKIKSPFNAYQNRGLPPSPICNPGFDSLYAAFHPTPSDYLYYLTDPNGQIHYAKTLPEHNQNIAKYLN